MASFKRIQWLHSSSEYTLFWTRPLRYTKPFSQPELANVNYDQKSEYELRALELKSDFVIAFLVILFFLSQANLSQPCDSNSCDIFFLSQVNLSQTGTRKNTVHTVFLVKWSFPWVVFRKPLIETFSSLRSFQSPLSSSIYKRKPIRLSCENRPTPTPFQSPDRQ